MPRAYYNEIEPAAVHVLRALIDESIISPGEVDDRSIKEVRPSDLIGYTQCHFFAGGGLWSIALRLAGWPDEWPVWTGSCPCQPFSQAGKGLGRDDPRHLWPDFHRLIAGARPEVVFGEQVAGAAGYAWFDGVAADLERENYACEAFDIPAAAVDAPHIRQRLYWVATANSARLSERKQGYDVRAITWQDARVSSGRGRGGYGESDMAYSNGAKPRRWQFGFQPWSGIHHGDETKQERASLWYDHEWRTGADGKARRVKPGLRLLADGVPGRVGLLRIAGNAIVPQLAAEVIKAFMESE